MSKKLKLRKRDGNVVNLPTATIKKVLSKTGFTGNLLLKGVAGVLREATGLAKAGVITVTNLEKAIVKAISNTNKVAMDSAQKLTKKVLK